jgi:hypothetical protein
MAELHDGPGSVRRIETRSEDRRADRQRQHDLRMMAAIIGSGLAAKGYMLDEIPAKAVYVAREIDDRLTESDALTSAS